MRAETPRLEPRELEGRSSPRQIDDGGGRGAAPPGRVTCLQSCGLAMLDLVYHCLLTKDADSYPSICMVPRFSARALMLGR
jgi:hypothetical protein